MSVQLPRGVQSTFRAYCETTKWSQLRAADVTISDLKSAVNSALTPYASRVDQVHVEAFESWIQSTSIGMVITITPTADFATGDASDPRELWQKYLAPVPPVTPVTPNSAGYAILFGLNAVALSHSIGTTDAPAFTARLFVVDPPMVVDAASVASGLVEQVPQLSPSPVANALRATNTITSDDPARNGTTGVGDAARNLLPDAAPSWLVPVAIGAAVLLGLVVVGYSARGIAQLAREVT